ncbi:Phosphatidylserine/phosphatidylglycerophosphate/cardiolipin synthase [Thermus arciformis]|uniref:phospholipase D n=1 Tax=Thermus arciformis TaxID=482827 RepID=A0A1G7DT72_9DEIN|nr:phospholipase D-like domain-containing protein [Thermus arciformis]SDE54651.1 Phosphatidylserine/phosphatidylglycerophosphate/cardiolipin synthase [Thermus arciformis]
MGTKRRRKEIAGLPGYLLLLVLLFLWLFQELRPRPAPPAEAGAAEVYFMPEEGPRAKARLLALMDGARESLEGAFYEFRDLEIAQGLLRAKARGVRVRLYGESDYREDFRRYLVAASLGQTQEPPRVPRAALRERVRPTSIDCEEVAGIPVCYDEREGFMHHKFLVVDGKAVWTGSTNMTWNAFARNNENSLLLPSPTLAQGYAREFEALFRGEKEGLGEPVAFALEGVEGVAYFSPKGGAKAREALLEAVARAQKEILVAAFVLTDRKLVEALERAHRRGVSVRVLLERRNLQDSLEEDLLKAGIPVRQDGNPYTMHHKVLVLDGTYVVTGSYNFTARAYGVNNENLLVLQSPSLAERYRKEVLRLWEAGSPL